MASPGVFIHSGTLGGTLSELIFAVSADTCPAATPVTSAPPSRALPSPKICRRDNSRLAPSVSPAVFGNLGAIYLPLFRLSRHCRVAILQGLPWLAGGACRVKRLTAIWSYSQCSLNVRIGVKPHRDAP